MSIPASDIVQVIPNVIDAGGTGLDLGGLMLTTSTAPPIGAAVPFTSVAAVQAYFGSASTEALAAAKYFLGYENAFIKPAQLLFAQYTTGSVKPYLRGASVAALTLAQLQAITSGTITLTINGLVKTSGSINLSAAASFSAAAALIQTALAAYDAVVTGSIATNTLTVTAVSSGTLAVGQVISGTGVTAGTTITAFLSGTGGTGTYQVSVSQTVSSTTISAGPATVTYDAQLTAFVITGGTPGVTGTITEATASGPATTLKLTAAAGAVTSQGAAPMTPGSAMTLVTTATRNFASFMTLFKPSIDDMVAFATWADAQNGRFVYSMWDTDPNAITTTPATTAGARIIAAGLANTVPIYAPAQQLATFTGAFVMGAIASIDFNRVNGRVNLAFQSQDGLAAGVSDKTTADQLIANGYNFYGSYATENDDFVFFYPATVTGPFDWLDSLVNEIWMTNEFQLALMNLLTTVNSVPYNDAGYGLIEAALLDPINAAVNFGAIRPGVPLSSLQRAQVNSTAAADVSSTIEQRGWYLQVQAASPAVRAARGSPPIYFWYTDGQSVQSIILNSVEVE